MAKLILGPFIGGASSTGANLWGRADGLGRLRAWLGHQADLSDAWLAAESLPLAAADGFAGVAPVSGLSPDTRYFYHLSLSPRPPNPSFAPYLEFTTFPQPGEKTSFAFAFGSCFRPEEEQGGQIYRTIARQRLKDNLRFILLLGDQIYADDCPLDGIEKVATSLADYRAVYAYTFSRPPFRDLLASLPVFMTMDDHEVDDDWTWTDSNRTLAQIPIWDRVTRWIKGRPRVEWQIPRGRVQDALKAYWEHQGMHAPHFVLPPSLDSQEQYTLDPEDPGSLAYTFTYGAAAFFVLDTRTMRVKGRAETSMLGEGQWKVLEKWFLRVKDVYPVKFLVTSCALLFSMWIDIPRDRWSGFPKERERLLRFLADHGIEGVYLLTGDLHTAHAVRAELLGPHERAFPLWEFCASPFEQAPNRLSSRTYRPIRSGSVKNQQLLFCERQHNFGLVRVDFSNHTTPRVKFEVYGKTGVLIGEAGE
ncbi:MAG TPA: alkaline phosphatase D family protein [Candidatus Binatia bacterium]